MTSSLFKIPTLECPDIWIRLPRHKWPKTWSSMEDPVVPLERNLHSRPLAGLLFERQFEKILLKYGWENQCQTSKDTVDNYRTMFESRISAGATDKLPCSENLSISSWSNDMEGHAKKCVERYCWETKRLNNSTKYQLHALMTITSKKKNRNPWENCQKYALTLF